MSARLVATNLKVLGLTTCAIAFGATSLADPTASETPAVSAAKPNRMQWYTDPPSEWDTVGPVTNIFNKGVKPAYGTRLAYFSKASNQGFDLASADIAISRATNPYHTAYLTHWFVQVSPLDDQHFWTATIAELNPVNRGDDPGWTDTLSTLPRFAGGMRVVPETKTFGEPGTGGNIEYSYAVAPSGAPNTSGHRAATYNGLMIEANSIAANGRGVLALGASEVLPTRQLPETPFEIRSNWRQGVTTVNARFSQGAAVHIGTGQAIALTDDGNLTLQTDAKGRTVRIINNGKRMMSLDLNTGNLYVSGRIVENSEGPN
jgi:hypothetical protein